MRDDSRGVTIMLSKSSRMETAELQKSYRKGTARKRQTTQIRFFSLMMRAAKTQENQFISKQRFRESRLKTPGPKTGHVHSSTEPSHCRLGHRLSNSHTMAQQRTWRLHGHRQDAEADQTQATSQNRSELGPQCEPGCLRPSQPRIGRRARDIWVTRNTH